MTVLKFIFRLSPLMFLAACGASTLPNDPLKNLETTIAEINYGDFPYDTNVKLYLKGRAPEIWLYCSEAYLEYADQKLSEKEFAKFRSDLKNSLSWMQKNKTAKLNFTKHLRFGAFFATDSGNSFVSVLSCPLNENRTKHFLRQMESYEKTKQKHLTTYVPFNED